MKKLVLLAFFGCLATVAQAQQRHDLQLGVHWPGGANGPGSTLLGFTLSGHRTLSSRWAVGVNGGFHRALGVDNTPLLSNFTYFHLGLGARLQLSRPSREVQWYVEPILSAMWTLQQVPLQPPFSMAFVDNLSLTQEQIEQMRLEHESWRQPRTVSDLSPSLGVNAQCAFKIDCHWGLSGGMLVHFFNVALTDYNYWWNGRNLLLSPSATLVYAW